MAPETYATRAPMISCGPVRCCSPSPGTSPVRMQTSLAVADKQKLVVCAVSMNILLFLSFYMFQQIASTNIGHIPVLLPHTRPPLPNIIVYSHIELDSY